MPEVVQPTESSQLPASVPAQEDEEEMEKPNKYLPGTSCPMCAVSLRKTAKESSLSCEMDDI